MTPFARLTHIQVYIPVYFYSNLPSAKAEEPLRPLPLSATEEEVLREACSLVLSGRFSGSTPSAKHREGRTTHNQLPSSKWVEGCYDRTTERVRTPMVAACHWSGENALTWGSYIRLQGSYIAARETSLCEKIITRDLSALSCLFHAKQYQHSRIVIKSRFRMFKLSDLVQNSIEKRQCWPVSFQAPGPTTTANGGVGRGHPGVDPEPGRRPVSFSSPGRRHGTGTVRRAHPQMTHAPSPSQTEQCDQWVMGYRISATTVPR